MATETSQNANAQFSCCIVNCVRCDHITTQNIAHHFRPDDHREISRKPTRLINLIEKADVVGVRSWLERNIPSQYQVCFSVYIL